MLRAAYLVYLLQNQRTDSSSLVLDVYLTELVPVSGDRADFPYGILITHPVKEFIEQQSWGGEIIDERDSRQGRGRPRKQYLVRWKASHVGLDHLLESVSS